MKNERIAIKYTIDENGLLNITANGCIVPANKSFPGLLSNYEFERAIKGKNAYKMEQESRKIAELKAKKEREEKLRLRLEEERNKREAEEQERRKREAEEQEQKKREAAEEERKKREAEEQERRKREAVEQERKKREAAEEERKRNEAEKIRLEKEAKKLEQDKIMGLVPTLFVWDRYAGNVSVKVS